MVFVVSDFNTVKEAIRSSRYILYTEKVSGSKRLVRVKAGMIGYEREYDLNAPNDREEYEELMMLLRMFGATKVERVVRDEEFLG